MECKKQTVSVVTFPARALSSKSSRMIICYHYNQLNVNTPNRGHRRVSLFGLTQECKRDAVCLRDDNKEFPG